MNHEKPLTGVRVVEMGQLIAGPFAGQMLSYFGAEVIKIESPEKGDPLRTWRLLDDDGTSYWWRSIARNKKSVTLDLNNQAGRSLARALLLKADVLIENFRPGKMESWNMGPDVLRKENPGLVYTRVSGYGQTGPYSTKPGFASACEAVGGFRHINGYPDRPPVRPNLSMGDTLAAMHAVIGTMMALYHRQSENSPGQVVDVSIFESVFNLLESVVPEYSGAGVIREPSGSTLTGIVPTNTYLCQDGKYVVIGGNGDSIFQRLMVAADRQDMAEDPRLADNQGRVANEQEIDKALSEWTGSLDAASVLAKLDKADVPSASIYNVADMFEDEHFKARNLLERVEVSGKPLDLPAVHPRLEDTPGSTEWPGPELGQHTDEVLADVLGLSIESIVKLHEDGIV